jgi:hypothetical protein
MRTSLVILSILRKLPCTPALHVDSSESAQHKGECPKNGITASEHGDGFGSGYSAMLGVYMYAALHQRPYCTTQWHHTSHGVALDEMFQMVGGSEYGPPATSQTERIKNVAWQKFDLSKGAQRHIFDAAHNNIRRFYFQHTKPLHESLNLFDGGGGASRNVAWHIRRGDVGPSKNLKRYLSNEEISRALLIFDKTYSEHVVHFFSEGDEGDFKPIIDTCVALRIECKWHLNSPVLATHYSFSIADILVMGHSSLSSSAGFLNDRGNMFKDTQFLASGSAKMNIQPLDIQSICDHLDSVFPTEL